MADSLCPGKIILEPALRSVGMWNLSSTPTAGIDGICELVKDEIPNDCVNEE